MQYFKMMVGLPGSGKSTAVDKKLKMANKIDLSAEAVSTDTIREVLTGDASDQTQNAKVFDIAKKAVVDLLNDGKSVVFDATNVSSKYRVSFLSDIRRSVDSNRAITYTAHVMCTPIETCLAYNEKRAEDGGRFVPEDVIYRMMKQFQVPQYFEGFDYINFDASNADILSSGESDLHDLSYRVGRNFDQNTPYHKYDLFTHCKKVAEQFDENDVRHYAGYIHDVGKALTKVTDENGVSHYYSHENVGAYKLLSYLDYFTIDNRPIDKDDVLEILFYVNYHMHIRDIIKSDKAISKYKKLWGEERFNKLVEFMEADNKASGRNK